MVCEDVFDSKNLYDFQCITAKMLVRCAVLGEELKL